MNKLNITPLFELGHVVVTCGVNEKISESGEFATFVRFCLVRHQSGDWGQICDEDGVSNSEALEYGNRIMSVYSFNDTEDIWIITEADRSSTTVLFPEEY